MGHATVEYQERLVRVSAEDASLEGNLVLPDEAAGVVLFAHGSGSSRHSPRNRYVARALNGQSLGTLLIDLLTAEEEAIDARTAHLRFDIELLARRLVAAIDWLSSQAETRRLKIGCFGASTGAGAALLAAVSRPEAVAAVVSRGGRPDLAGPLLDQVRAPTLLIVGGRDYQVIELNQSALEQLTHVHHKRLEIVPGATHLFEEHGALEQVAHLAADWFKEHLIQTPFPAGVVGPEKLPER